MSLSTTGKIKIEDAGWDWKILGPDVNASNTAVVDYVAYVSVYACMNVCVRECAVMG